MKISAAQAYCILDTVGSSILTKSGEISVSYLLELPEAYSLDRSDLEERHNELFRAFQYVRTGFIHKQDVFLRRKFKPEYVIEGEGYIQTAERKYFDGREYLHHPSAVKYNQAVTDFVAVDNPESVPNILRIKANRKSFSKQTTVSVATEGGFFYSFNVTYADSLEHTNYFLPDMSSIRPDTIYLNEVSQTHLIAPEKVIYIDYGDTCIQVSKAENTENIVRMIAATGKVEEFPRQTNVSLATEGGKFYTFNVDYRQQPEAFVYEIGEKRPEKKANVILTDNIIPAGERDQVMSRVYNAKRGIFNKGIVRNKIVFSVNNLHIYDNLLLFTFEIENKSKLPYDIDYIRYYIIDKKTAKLTASQEVDQQALFSENYSPRIEGNGRMKYVIAFDKFTIPDEKVFRIEINEKNGGRHVLFDLENSDIVNVEDI